jgi:hypothetical protein
MLGAVNSLSTILIDSDYIQPLSWVTNNIIAIACDIDIYTSNYDGTRLLNLTNNDRQTSYVLKDNSSNGNVLYGIEKWNNNGSYFDPLLFMNAKSAKPKSIPQSTFNGNVDYGCVFNDGSAMIIVSTVVYNSLYGYIPNFSIISYNTNTQNSVVISSSIGGIGISKLNVNGVELANVSSWNMVQDLRYIVNPDGSNLRSVNFSTFTSISNLVGSKTSNEIFFTGYANGENYLCKSPSSLSSYQILLTTTSNIYPSAAYGGKVFLIDETDFPSPVWYSMNYDGSGIMSISNKLAVVANNTFTKIAYINDNDTNYTLRVLDIASGVETSLASGVEAGLVDGAMQGFHWNDDGTFNYVVSKHINGSYEFQQVYITDKNLQNAHMMNNNVVTSYNVNQCGTSYVYQGDHDIWLGDSESSALPPLGIAVPSKTSDVRIVVPEGAGTRGTINPDSGKPVSIGFNSSASGTFSLRIFTQFGEMVYQAQKESSDGSGVFSWIPSNLASGVYIVHVEGPGLKINKKIALLR